MEIKDDVASQKFIQTARESWHYDVVSKTGRKFQVKYAVQPYGYINEVLNEVFRELVNPVVDEPPMYLNRLVLIWNREFKAGENVAKTWVQHVQGVA